MQIAGAPRKQPVDAVRIIIGRPTFLAGDIGQGRLVERILLPSSAFSGNAQLETEIL